MASPDNAADTLGDLDGRTDKLSIHPSLSDSEDDIDLDATNENFLGGLNVSNRLKNLLRIKDFDSDDDDDETTEPLFSTPSILKTPGALESLLPPRKSSPSSPSSLAAATASPLTTKNTPQKKKTQKKKKPAKEGQPKNDRFAELLARAMISASDSSDSETDKKLSASRISAEKVKKRTKKAQKQPDEAPKSNMLLDSDSDSDSEKTKPKRKTLSKKAMIEMHKENDRLRRTKEVKIQPRTKKRSLNDLLRRIEENNSKEKRSEEKCRTVPVSEASKETSKPILTIQRPAPRNESDSDSDIEIIGGPSKVRTLPLSPDRAKIPAPLMSPTRPTGMTHGDLNRSLLGRISRDLLLRRKKLEDEARAQGVFTSAEERALRHLQREKDAEIIDLEVQKRLLGGRRRHSDDEFSVPDEEGDEEGEENEEGEDYLMHLSGQEEDQESEVEGGDEGMADDETASLNKEEADDEDDDEPMIGRRNIRPRRKMRDDEEGEEARLSKIPEPAHSIANFFKNKKSSKEQAPSDSQKGEENDKSLRRLIRRTSDTLINKDEEAEQSEIDPQVEQVPADRDVPPVETSKVAPIPVQQGKKKSAFLEDEAEEEEDEFYGMGGQDGEDDEDLDEYEQDDLLIDRNEETDRLDEGTVRETFNKQMAETDKNMIERLLKDITSGGLRRRRAAQEAGFMLDDYDVYDEEDDLVSMRRAAAAKRRKLLEKSGNILHLLAQDPATAAFARAAQPILEKSDDEDVFQESEQKSDEETPVAEQSNDVEITESSTTAVSIVPPRTDEIVALEEDEDSAWTLDIHIQSKSTTTLIQPNRQSQKSVRSMERFKNLLTEGGAFGASNTSSPRSGFGSTPSSKSSSGSPAKSAIESQAPTIELNEPKRSSKLRKVLSSRTGSFN